MLKANNTLQRRMILHALAQVTSHPTAEEVFDLVKPLLPKISLATVYRNLEKMTQLGDVLCLEIAGKQRRYDAVTAPHFHCRCPICGKVSDVESDESTRMILSLRQMVKKLNMENYQLEFSKQCAECRVRG